jgi:hypothetical protein
VIELRELKAKDILPMVKILQKIGLKHIREMLTPDKIKELMTAMKSEDPKPDQDQQDDQQGDQKQEEKIDGRTILGFNLIMEVVGLVLDNLPACESDIYKFIGSISNLTAEQVADLPLGEFTDIIVRILKDDGFSDFFKAVSKFVE